VTGWSDSSGKLSRHFGPLLERGGDRTTTLRQQDVGAEQPSFVLLPMQDKTEEFLQRLGDTLCRIQLTSYIVPHLPFSGASSLAPLFPFLTSGPDLGAWPDCWISVEFFHAPILQKGSGSTTTISFNWTIMFKICKNQILRHKSHRFREPRKKQN